jgi:thiamine pyrophosphate-dependent acetolactate synthase large subunit-like protein
MGAFQESAQLEAARPYTKFCARIEALSRFSNLFSQAMRYATYGRPGPVYLELTVCVCVCARAPFTSFIFTHSFY